MKLYDLALAVMAVSITYLLILLLLFGTAGAPKDGAESDAATVAETVQP